MRLLVAIDDTDNLESEMGTGRVSRELADRFESAFEGLTTYGCVRQQLLVDPRVPYTTHNSSATVVLDSEADTDLDRIAAFAGDFLVDVSAEGSDPGLCVAAAADVPESATAFGVRAQNDVLDKSEAYDLADAEGLFLDEYGGTGDGVIGALAGVGLTHGGDCGRFVAYGRIREYGATVSVAELRADGIRVVNGDTELSEGTVETRDWVRPELRDGRPTLPVEATDDGTWSPANLT